MASQDFRLVSATPARPRPTARECRQLWAEKLSSSTRPRSEATSSTQGDFGLDAVTNLLLNLPEADLVKIVIRRLAKTRAVYVDGTTLHIHTLCLCKKDEVNSILLATHFGVVDEIRIHNFHLYRYLFRGPIHVRIAQSHWGAVQTVLSYVSRRFGEEEGKPIKITFDEFLRPAVTAWKNREPHAHIVCDLSESVTKSITTTVPIPFRYPYLSCFTRGYSSDEDREVDIENDDYDKREDFEILLFLGYPSVPYV